jgi:subtilisin family serine protease
VAFNSETYADVEKRISRDIDASEEPNQATVNAWLSDGEQRVRAALRAHDITVPTTSPGVDVLEYLSVTYGTGRTKEALAAADGRGDNEYGRAELEEFMEALQDIHSNPETWRAMLAGPSTASDAGGVRSHVTDDQFEGRASDNAEFKPVFVFGDGGNQF